MDENLLVHDKQSFLLDLSFVIRGSLREAMEESQIAMLQDYLSVRYDHAVLHFVYDRLVHSYQWIARNWEYFMEVGMIRQEGDDLVVENALIYAIYEVVASADYEDLPSVPERDPAQLVPIAQRIIKQSKNQA